MISFSRYRKGYVRIRLEGYSPERFLNLCRARGITVWDLKNAGTTYEMNLTIRDFKRLGPLCRKARARVRVIQRHGLPFFLYRNRDRKGFAAGILLGVALLYLLSLFIWNIHIEGNSARTTDVILDYLKTEEVRHGMPKSRVDCKEIQSMLRIHFPDLIWVSAQVKGTRLLIRVRENQTLEREEQNEEEQSPSDLRAERKGRITSVLVRSGVARVEPGQEVEAGELLVSGQIPLLDDGGEVTGYQETAADADVWARTEYAYEDSFPLSHEVRAFTGRKRVGFYLKAGQKILICAKKPEFSHYTTLYAEYPLRLTENFYLPVAFGSIRYEEYENQVEKYEKKAAEDLARANLKEFFENLTQKGVQIVENNVKIEVGKNTCRASGRIICLEDIGRSTAFE